MKRGIVRILCTGLLLALGGCGGASSSKRTVGTFTADDAVLFNDAIDSVGDPERLGGVWSERWDARLQARLKRSDFVGEVQISSLHADVDPEKRKSFRIDVKVRDAWRGESPGELSLRVHEHQAGFQTVRSAERTLPGSRMILFARWYLEADSDEIRAHWHMLYAVDSTARKIKGLTGRWETVQRSRLP